MLGSLHECTSVLALHIAWRHFAVFVYVVRGSWMWGSPLHTFGQPGSVTDVSNEAHSFVGKANLRIGVGHYKLGLPLFCRWVLKRMSSGGLRVCLSALQ
jgi:hypothetical protein